MPNSQAGVTSAKTFIQSDHKKQSHQNGYNPSVEFHL